MARIDKDGNWIDPSNTPVPPKYIKPLDKRRDALVVRHFKKLLALEKRIGDEKAELVPAIDAYLDDVAKEKKVRENWKGNVCIDSFDGSMRIERKMDDVISFDEKLQLVKTKIDQWFAARIAGADKDLRTVVSRSFQVNKKGCLSTSRLMSLFTYDIDEPDWKTAMNLLRDSIKVTRTRQYFSFTIRNGESSRNLCLSFNSTAIDGNEPTSKGQTEVADDESADAH